jgi:AraC-like DNA-binding protein
MSIPAQWLEPAFHPTYARLLCMMLRRYGVEIPRLLAGTGLTWTELVNADKGIDFVRMRRLIHAALKLAGSPSLGMEVGIAVPVSAHGQVGYAAVASKDVRQAFDVMSTYSKLRTSALAFRVQEDAGGARMQIQELFDLEDVRVPVLEAVLLVVVQLLESLLGQSLDGVQYRFPYPEPAWSAAYASRLKGQIRFGAGCMEIALPQALLDLPCLTSDPAAYASARRDCEQGMAYLQQENDILQQVRLRLKASDDALPGYEAMARQLHMSARTLLRRLKQHGTSYQALVDEVRKEQAQWYLRHTSYPVETIAERLGYLDTSNFSRTFRRWFGVSPSVYRQTPPQN